MLEAECEYVGEGDGESDSVGAVVPVTVVTREGVRVGVPDRVLGKWVLELVGVGVRRWVRVGDVVGVVDSVEGELRELVVDLEMAWEVVAEEER